MSLTQRDKKPSGMGEFDLIHRYLRPLATHESAFALKDDAALLSVPEDHDLVVSKDMLVRGRHFFADDPPNLIAKKALRTNISDIIAKGAKPAFYSLGLAFPEVPSSDFMAGFSAGLYEDQQEYGLSLIGGDTTASTSDFVVSVTVYGHVPKDGMKTRLTAKREDCIYVTGDLGASALGLALRLGEIDPSKLSTETHNTLLNRYLLPEPPASLASIIAEYASASMDISDGLFADVCHLAKASGVGVVIDVDTIPFSQAVEDCLSHYPQLRENALNGGDDYQTLVCIPPEQCESFEEAVSQTAHKVSLIGKVVDGAAGQFKLRGSGQPFEYDLSGFTHF